MPITTSSRQTPFLCALVIGFTTIILYATGTSIAMLAVGRYIQGISVSILFSVGLAYLVDTIGRDEVRQWIGFVLLGLNTGVILSPFSRRPSIQQSGIHSRFSHIPWHHYCCLSNPNHYRQTEDSRKVSKSTFNS